jgi:hypothetical protein
MASSGICACRPERSRRIGTSRLHALAAALALPVIAGACVPADALAPKTPPPTLDAALGDVAHPALNFASAFFSGRGVVAPAINPKRCPFESTSQFFVCSPVFGNDLTINQRFTLQDASGGSQSAFDATTTTSLHLENDAATSSGSVNGQQVLDLTGLGTTRHTLNGTSLTVLSGTTTVDGSLVQVNEERRTTITDLVLPVIVAGAPVPWPLSGTVDTRSRDIIVGGDTSVFIATMRFDGSSVVTLTVTVPGGIRTCRVNLVTDGVGCAAGAGPSVPVGADVLP